MANISLALFDELFLKLYQMLKLRYLKSWLDFSSTDLLTQDGLLG